MTEKTAHALLTAPGTESAKNALNFTVTAMSKRIANI